MDNFKPSVDKNKIVKSLKDELVHVLMQLDEIGTVVFEDIDCDGGIYNFSDVAYNDSDDTCTIKISMWHDNLPHDDRSSERKSYKTRSSEVTRKIGKEATIK